MVQQPLDHIAAQNGLFIDFLAVLRLDLHVLDHLVAFLDTHQRAKLTEALAAGLFHADIGPVMVIMGREDQIDFRVIRNQIFQQLVDLIRTGGNTAGTGANQHAAIVAVQFRNGFFPFTGQIFNILDHQPLPLNSAISARAFSGVMAG